MKTEFYKKDYYYLPTDCYGQPNGYVQTISLTPEKYAEKSRTMWLYDSYYAACARAQD